MNFDYDEDDGYSEELQNCSFCEAEFEYDPDEADHADDCPRNPFGYNHPNFLTNISQLLSFEEKIAMSNMLLEKLNWDSKQGKDYLIEKYNKRSRQLLSEEEFAEFIEHLENLVNSPKNKEEEFWIV